MRQVLELKMKQEMKQYTHTSSKITNTSKLISSTLDLPALQ